MNVGEVEGLLQFWGDAEYQHMAVFGFYFCPFQYGEAVLGTKITVVRFVIKLAVFCKHKTVYCDVFGLNPLAIVLYFSASIVGLN